MKKKLLFILSLFTLSSSLFSQGFLGLNTGNYAGITGVMLQPASIVDSRFKFDINLFSTDIRYNNNYFLLDRDVLLKFNKKNFGDYQTFRSKYLSEAALAPGEKAFFNIANRTQIPLSFMVSLGEKSALALNFQSRSMIQGRNISQGLAKLAYNDFYYPPLNNQPVDASGLSLRSLNWVETGLTYGRVLLNSGNHFLKGAFTAKYLAGVSSLNLVANNFAVGVNTDSTFNFAADRVGYEHNNNADFKKVFDKSFRPDANAFGWDAGLVYEYRGHLNNFKYIRNDDEVSYEADRRDLNKYIFKLGVSLLDAGMFRFNKATDANSFTANISNWDIRRANYSSLSEFDTALANRVTPLPNDAGKYNVYLPGALSAQLDVRFVKGLYLNAVAYRPLKLGSEAGTRFSNYGYYSITPRYERRHFGVYIPYTFFDKADITNYRDNWLGLSVRLGPLFFGSSNLGTVAFNQKLKAADFFVGLKVGFTYGKPSKVTRLFTQKKESEETDYDKMLATKESQEREEAIAAEKAQRKAYNQTVLNRDTTTATRLVVDYSKGQVYTDGKSGQVIIVNNNYYGNPTTANRDSVYYLNAPPSGVQQNQYRVSPLSGADSVQIRKADSSKRVLNDSLSQKREQVDSLINRLYNLRQKLDSASKSNQSSLNNPKNNNASYTEDTTATTAIREANQNRVDTVQNISPAADPLALRSRQTALEDSFKKKLTAATVAADQSVANRSAPPQQTLVYDAGFEDYDRQSKRLQDDIDRLEKQVAYNRSLAYAARTPVYTQQPVYYTQAPPAAMPYPVTVPVSTAAAARDTVVIRDTVFLTRTDTVTRNIPGKPSVVTVAVPKEKIVKEKIDYSKLPPENILFATGQAAIRQVYIGKLNYLAGILRQNPALMISIAGHTDNTGSPEANELLSLKRANAVKTFFVRRGINETRMQVTAVAAENPLVSGNTRNAKAQNRRVEIKILE